MDICFATCHHLIILKKYHEFTRNFTFNTKGAFIVFYAKFFLTTIKSEKKNKEINHWSITDKLVLTYKDDRNYINKTK